MHHTGPLGGAQAHAASMHAQQQQVVHPPHRIKLQLTQVVHGGAAEHVVREEAAKERHMVDAHTQKAADLFGAG